MRWLAVGCAVVAVGAIAAAVLVTAWALLAVPPAVIFGIAAWRGIGPRTVLNVIGEQDDPGMGPSGMLP